MLVVNASVCACVRINLTDFQVTGLNQSVELLMSPNGTQARTVKSKDHTVAIVHLEEIPVLTVQAQISHQHTWNPDREQFALTTAGNCLKVK